MKEYDVSFLRKQQSRFISTQAEPQAIWSFNFWTAAFAGMTPLPGYPTGWPAFRQPEERQVASFG